jgi:hypothetical protein
MLRMIDKMREKFYFAKCKFPQNKKRREKKANEKRLK